MDDDELRMRLRAADPARHLASGPPRPALELPEDTMSTSTKPTSPTPRSRLVPLAAAAVVLLIAIGGYLLSRGGDDDTGATGKPTPSPSSATFEGTAVYPIVAAGSAQRCAPPDAAGLAKLDAAFEGTVTGIAGNEVSLRPEVVFTGPAHDSVVVMAPKTIAEMLPVDFEKGQEYVVAVDGGVVQLCGYTTAATPSVEKLYTDAFPDAVRR